VARNGDIYFADTLNGRIRVVALATGRIATIAGDGRTARDGQVGDEGPAQRAQLSQPSGLAVAPNGDVYVADTGHNRVRRIDAGTGTITTIAGDGRAGSTGDGGPATRARLAAPVGLALGSSSLGPVVYVADFLNNRVRVIGPGGDMATLDGPDGLRAPTRVAYHPAGWLYVKDASPDGVTAVATSTPSALASTADDGSGEGTRSIPSRDDRPAGR
jgi:DNA-binding beta-propeller fold protein YncE